MGITLVFAFAAAKAVHGALAPGVGLVYSPTASVLIAVAVCLVLTAVYRLPGVVAAVAVVAFLLESQVWPLLVALYVVTVRRSFATSSALGAAAFVPAWFAGFRDLVDMPEITSHPSVLLLVPMALGLATRGQGQLTLSLEREVEHLRAQAELREEQVRLAERARIAREMHDILAHRLSLLALHSGVLQRRREDLPAQVRERLDLLRSTSARALDELRELLGALRDPVNPAPLAPTPENVAELVEESRAAGTPVNARIGELEELPMTVRFAAYRIVQEGLTNARRHGGGGPVTLRVAAHDGRLVVDVDNPAPPRVADTRREQAGPEGHGLRGLAERVAILGGTLRAGGTPEGRFALHAEIPIRTAASAVDLPGGDAPAWVDRSPEGVGLPLGGTA